MRLVIFTVFLVFSFPARADVACQYDCLAKGHLPEICSARCGITGDGSSASGGQKKVHKKSAEQKKEKGDGSSASGGSHDHDRSEYFACIKECREMDNTLSDCKKLCGEE